MVLESLDGSLCIVSSMVAGRGQLNLDAFAAQMGYECLGRYIVGDFVDWYTFAVGWKGRI